MVSDSMAITKIKAIHANLNYSLAYVTNPEKTDPMNTIFDYITNPEKSGNRLYVTSFNRHEDTVYAEMKRTKKYFEKDNVGLLGYHIIQSFKPGEVDPDMAHKISTEFAERFLADKYETVVSTHLDKGHIHSHIVFNSVSYLDGKKYRNQFRDYYDGIRKISDELCREYDLNVITPEGKGKHRMEWEAESRGEPTRHSLLRDDIDDIISKSFTFQTFIDQLRKRGYQVKYGDNVKHIAVKPPNGGGRN